MWESSGFPDPFSIQKKWARICLALVFTITSSESIPIGPVRQTVKTRTYEFRKDSCNLYFLSSFISHRQCKWARGILNFPGENGAKVKLALQIPHPFPTHKSCQSPGDPTDTISCLPLTAESLLTSWTSHCWWLLSVSFVQF